MSISCLAVTGHSDLPETHLLIGLFKAGIAMEVLCPEDAPHRQLLLDNQVPVTTLALKKRRDKAGIQLIKSRLASRQFHIIHAFNNKAVSNALVASKGYDCKFIAYRGIEGNVSYYDPASWMTYLNPRVDVIVCVADAIRRYFWNMRFLGFPAPVKKAMTIYKGHDPAWYDFPAADLKPFGVPEDAFLVGCTVNDRPRKGLKYLIEAASLLPADLPIHFVLIGNINSPELLAQIENSPCRDRFHLTGFQKNAAAVIKNCDVCILPAVKREGLPKGIIEGMIQGVAPIVTNSGGSPELIEHEKSGLIVEPANAQLIVGAVQQLLGNPEFLAQVKKDARKRIQDAFPAGQTVKDHHFLYGSLTSVL